MRFEIAVAAVLAADDLSSSVVSAGGIPQGHSVEERARLRKEAVEAISGMGPNDWREGRPLKGSRGQRHGRILRRGKNLFEDRVRKLNEVRRRRLSAATQRQRKEEGAINTTSNSEFLDLGVLSSTPMKEQRNSPEDKIQLLSSSANPKVKTKTTSGDADASSHGATPDLGILSSITKNEKLNALEDKVVKLLGATNLQHQKRGSSSDPSGRDFLPDIGIISSQKTREERKDKNKFTFKAFADKNGPRRLEDLSFEDFDFLGDNLVASAVNYYCTKISSFDTNGQGSSCETCQVTYVDDDPALDYNVNIDCNNVPEEYAEYVSEMVYGLNSLCSYGFCENCDIDADNNRVNMETCSLPDELQDVFSEYVNGNSDLDELIPEEDFNEALEGLEDMFTKPIAYVGNATCGQFSVIDTYYGLDTPSCTTCELVYPDDPDSPYDLKIDCPNVPEEFTPYLEEVFVGFQDLCAYGICDTCNVDSENFLIDMESCSFSDDFSDMLNSFIGGAINSTVNGTDGMGGGFDYGTMSLENLDSLFFYYFGNLCDGSQDGSEESSCRACGEFSGDKSSFSFEFDCPSKLSASDGGFGSYMVIADSFCYCTQRMGVKCSTCDVNPWESTIDIQGCVPLEEGEANYCGDNYSDFTPNDLNIFLNAYTSSCNPDESYYLQDTIIAPDCECTFDEATQKASFSCQEKEVCRDISSYCPEKPLEFCDSYRIVGSLERDGTVSTQRCVYLSSPYEFSYCVHYGVVGDGATTAANVRADSSKPRGAPVCEMQVDGIRCNSCSLVHSDKDYIPTSIFNDMYVYYNCSNTVIGTNGPGNLSAYEILDDTVSYFIYQSLPCADGCDLCGASENELMTNPDGKFSSDLWKDGTEERCFDAQLDAMMGQPALGNEECQAIRDVARGPCGCKNPNPPRESGAHSLGKKFTVTGAVLLTMAATTFVQVLLA